MISGTSSDSPVAKGTTFVTFETQNLRDSGAASVVSGRDVELLAPFVVEARSVPVERMHEFGTSSVV